MAGTTGTRTMADTGPAEGITTVGLLFMAARLITAGRTMEIRIHTIMARGSASAGAATGTAGTVVTTAKRGARRMNKIRASLVEDDRTFLSLPRDR